MEQERGAPLTTEDLAAIEARLNAAPAGPWWFDDGEHTWRLFGGCPDPTVPCHGQQILKAPKKGTPYAEYWPNHAEAALIVNAPTDIRALLDEVRRLRADESSTA